MKRNEHPPWWLQLPFSGFRWFRKWWGGRWELWYVDHPVCSDIWHWREQQPRSDRPNGLCRGRPVVEDYSEVPNV